MKKSGPLYLGVFLLLACAEARAQYKTASGAYPAQAGVGGYSGPAQAQIWLRPIRSSDGILTMVLPADWNVTSPTGEHFHADSRRGESLNAGRVDVSADYGTMVSLVQANQAMGAPPQLLALLQRLVAPPLPPDGVVRYLLPQLSGGAMQNVHILGIRDMGAAGNMRTAMIYFQYTLLPQRDALWRSLLPPALMDQRQVPMQGLAVIATSPVFALGPCHTWTMLYNILEAPQPLFAANLRAYATIFSSVQVNMNAVQQNAAAAQQSNAAIAARANGGIIDPNKLRQLREGPLEWWKHQHDPSYTEGVDQLLNVMGGNWGYKDDTGWTGTLPIGQTPASYQKVWNCGQNDIRVSEIQPNLGCTEAKGLGH